MDSKRGVNVYQVSDEDRIDHNEIDSVKDWTSLDQTLLQAPINNVAEVTLSEATQGET